MVAFSGAMAETALPAEFAEDIKTAGRAWNAPRVRRDATRKWPSPFGQRLKEN